ncbi:carbohydrate-binding WSC domain [Cordyceps militaris]|uniref:Carbohydrate-binding WSC domain n=1 Tax=Cordyceps militaris TaxID=73501 RepID=A0A2H4SVP6_CORMI|nr:carbohydrate-binding WSC domain [Cordyceps militaris]
MILNAWLMRSIAGQNGAVPPPGPEGSQLDQSRPPPPGPGGRPVAENAGLPKEGWDLHIACKLGAGELNWCNVVQSTAHGGPVSRDKTQASSLYFETVLGQLRKISIIAMWFTRVLLAVSSAAAALGCTLPTDTPSTNIPQGFAIQVQNASYPVIHNRLINQWSAGGGDQHLYLSPAGNATGATLTLVAGVITQPNGGKVIRAVINGEYTAFDNTTKMFMTERGDPRGIFDVRYGCNPDTDKVQTELVFKERSGVTGGHLCFRLAAGNRHECRYSPPGNTLVDLPNQLCIKVTLVVVRT